MNHVFLPMPTSCSVLSLYPLAIPCLLKRLFSKVDADTALCSSSPPSSESLRPSGFFSEYVNKSWGENTATEREREREREKHSAGCSLERLPLLPLFLCICSKQLSAPVAKPLLSPLAPTPWHCCTLGMVMLKRGRAHCRGYRWSLVM